jgi:hypothetical protein
MRKARRHEDVWRSGVIVPRIPSLVVRCSLCEWQASRQGRFTREVACGIHWIEGWVSDKLSVSGGK